MSKQEPNGLTTRRETPDGYHKHPNGGGLVADTATVVNSAYIGPNACVSDNAMIYGDVNVFGDSDVYGDACVYGNADVYGDARVYGNADVYGDARVYGNACVYGDARVYGNACVYGDARVYGNSHIYGGVWQTSPLYIQGTQHALYIGSPGKITIGCETHPLGHWLTHYKEIGADNQYTAKQIREYGYYLRMLSEQEL